MAAACLFCANPAPTGRTKCTFHRHRAVCVGSPGCTNQVYARMRCVRHGGKRRCRVDGCESYARNQNLCFHHAASVLPLRVCAVDGCEKRAHAKNKCLPHSGVRRCRAEGCLLYARHAGYCAHHRQEPAPPASTPALHEDDSGWFEDVWSRVPYPATKLE
ncbi:hypothetical protein SPRG_14837 [Saprolegnia parasitica CBS 223.65]|uniref:Uncharacterized protein n=1 Tax=Saprolegnia parasitica (strain CBS 223.65) TaxID=695850 RepID=A0A067BN52_SAPPC|nr:hypothetical protein SPRG_14837 [Saprolegnia parasitica CBS 223.65]KDO19929.1 hypothetical protein SPRG_14837 [Saprolegnia parasitica CBS 223.65]|eukprot:XP_012209368.1 hypothetical protein SPRG_14837 [Saprolegnia parasitica CBS 223.65]